MKKTIDPRIKRKADLIIYHVETKHEMALSNDAKHDIYSNVNEVAEYWKEGLDKILENNPMRQLNELRLWLLREQPTGFEIIIDKMDRLKNKESIR